MSAIVRRATWDGCLPPTNDERRAHWAARYFAGGHHHGEHVTAAAPPPAGNSPRAGRGTCHPASIHPLFPTLADLQAEGDAALEEAPRTYAERRG